MDSKTFELGCEEVYRGTLTSDDETESIAFFVQRHLHIFEHDPWALYSWRRKLTVQSSAKTLMLDQNI